MQIAGLYQTITTLILQSQVNISTVVTFYLLLNPLPVNKSHQQCSHTVLFHLRHFPSVDSSHGKETFM